MDPEKQEKTPTELPKPTFSLENLGPQSIDSHSETLQNVKVEQGQGASGSGQQATAAVTATNDDRSSINDQSASQLATTSLPAIADDNDLIEKEWVAKAKQIVDQTKHDPHAQNREINKVKAGYIKKRFNKDIKVSEN